MLKVPLCYYKGPCPVEFYLDILLLEGDLVDSNYLKGKVIVYSEKFVFIRKDILKLFSIEGFIKYLAIELFIFSYEICEEFGKVGGEIVIDQVNYEDGVIFEAFYLLDK